MNDTINKSPDTLMEFSLCPRCNGHEKLNWTSHDGGLCYKCDGRGYQGSQNDSHDRVIAEKRAIWKNAKVNELKLKKIHRHLFQKITGLKEGGGVDDFIWAIRTNRWNGSKSNIVNNIHSSYVDMFELPQTYSLWESIILYMEQQPDRPNYGVLPSWAGSVLTCEISHIAEIEDWTQVTPDTIVIRKVGKNSLEVILNIKLFNN